MTDTSTERLRAWLAEAPPGVSVTVPSEQARALALTPLAPALTWRERVWSAPPETELRVAEAAEAVGRSIAWVHRRSGAAARRADSQVTPVPCARRDGYLVFTAGALRAFLRASAGD